MRGESPSPRKSPKAKSRLELDDFDSIEEEIAPEPQRPAPIPEQKQQQRPTLPGAYPDSYLSSQTASSGQTESYCGKHDTATATCRAALGVAGSSLADQFEQPTSVDGGYVKPGGGSLVKVFPLPELIEHEDMDMRGNKDSITTSTSAIPPPTRGTTPICGLSSTPDRTFRIC